MPHSKGCSPGHQRVRQCRPSTSGLVPPGQHEEGDSPAQLLPPCIFMQLQHQFCSLQPASPSLPVQQQMHSAGKLRPRVEPRGAQLRASRDGSSQLQPCGTAASEAGTCQPHSPAWLQCHCHLPCGRSTSLVTALVCMAQHMRACLLPWAAGAGRGPRSAKCLMGLL